MLNKKIILGLVGSGKSTLYRYLNETKQYNAVEIELPQSCINDEQMKSTLLGLYINSPNIDVIITHPYYLSKDFYKYKDAIELFYLDVPTDIRLQRIKERSNKINSDYKTLFPTDYILNESKYLKNFLNTCSIPVTVWHLDTQ